MPKNKKKFALAHLILTSIIWVIAITIGTDTACLTAIAIIWVIGVSLILISLSK